MMQNYSNYQEAETIAVNLFYQQKHQEAIELLKNLMEKFPGKLHEIAWSLALNYCLNGQYEKSLEMFDYGLNKGIFFPRGFRATIGQCNRIYIRILIIYLKRRRSWFHGKRFFFF